MAFYEDFETHLSSIGVASKGRETETIQSDHLLILQAGKTDTEDKKYWISALKGLLNKAPKVTFCQKKKYLCESDMYIWIYGSSVK